MKRDRKFLGWCAVILFCALYWFSGLGGVAQRVAANPLLFYALTIPFIAAFLIFKALGAGGIVARKKKAVPKD